MQHFRLSTKQMADKIGGGSKRSGNLTSSVASVNQGTDVYRETSGQNTREIGTRAYFSSVTQSVCAAVHLELSLMFSTRVIIAWSRAGSSHRTFNFIVSPHGSSSPIKRRVSKTIRDSGHTNGKRWTRDISTCFAVKYRWPGHERYGHARKFPDIFFTLYP